VTQAVKKRELDRLALKSGQISHSLLEKTAQISDHQGLFRVATARALRLLRDLLAISLSCPAISLSSSQAVDGAPPRNRHYPA
jgi:hypothetical protein